MGFKDWEPVYEQIIDDFCYSREEDERAARILSALASDIPQCDDFCLTGMFGSCATIIAGPSKNGGRLTDLLKGTTLTVGIGTALLLDEGTVPDFVVTDLDGDVATDLSANEGGATMVIHAHGDNIEAIRRYIPLVKGCAVLTTQSTPFATVRNFGGFTDGDRAVALAAHFGTHNIRLIGFDLVRPRVKEGSSIVTKAKKLRWAERLIEQLVNKDDLLMEYL